MPYSNVIMDLSRIGFDGPDSLSPKAAWQAEIDRVTALEPKTDEEMTAVRERLTWLQAQMDCATEQGGFQTNRTETHSPKPPEHWQTEAHWQEWSERLSARSSEQWLEAGRDAKALRLEEAAMKRPEPPNQRRS